LDRHSGFTLARRREGKTASPRPDSPPARHRAGPSCRGRGDAVIRARSGLKDPKRPIGSFIFLGPTGVGKTELARALAESLFDSEENMIRIDMSEYMEKHAGGATHWRTPGYVGYEEGGQLTEAVPPPALHGGALR